MGINFTIVEAEDNAAARTREWSFGIHWALPMLQSLLPEELWARLKTAQADPSRDASASDVFDMYNGQTGEVIKALPTGGMRRFCRRKLRALCGEGIDILYGKRLDRISYGASEQGVTAHFEDGTSISGSNLVGSDGPRSKVREILLGVERGAAKTPGLNVGVVTSSFTAEQALHLRQFTKALTIAFHPDNSYASIFAQDLSSTDLKEWRFQMHYAPCPLGFVGENGKKLKWLREKLSSYHDPFTKAINWVPEDTKVDFNELAYWETIDFDNRNGRATLAGDAAHPMTPQRGQGLNHAVNDAMNVVGAITSVRGGEKTLDDAMKEYGLELTRRGGEEVRASLANTHMVLDWDSLSKSALFAKSLSK